MIDLATIKADNAVRRAIKGKASSAPWWVHPLGQFSSEVWATIEGGPKLILDFTYQADDVGFTAFARNDPVEDVVDALVAEVERLRALTRDVVRCEE